MSGPDIFISYSREERNAARHFAESFAREGFNVWWDAALRSGQTFDEVIEKELRAAKAVVVLWSPRSVASRWVRAEATLADRSNKLVPVIIEACNLPIIFELTQAADLADWTGNTSDSRWQMLVSDLRRLVGDDEEEPAVAPAPKPVAKQEPVAAAPSEPKAPEAPKANKPPKEEDELIAALERLAKSRASKLSKPTPQEAERTEFFKWSDEMRLAEGDKLHCLRRLDSDAEEVIFAVSASGLRIGRTPPADIVVPGSAVSRAHCLVELAADQLRVTDLNSTNGTYIDSKRIDRTATLEVGSVLRVGNVSFEHEVRARAEVERLLNPANLNPDPNSPEPRIARPS